MAGYPGFGDQRFSHDHFLAGRGLREAGLEHPLLGALAVAVVITAATSLLQAYGIQTYFFSENRAPGGTLGNRNFVAHVDAFGLPVLLLAALRVRRGGAVLLSLGGVSIVTASLVLTRSRAAWLAFAAVALVFFAAMLVSTPLRRDGRTWRRLAGVIIFVACGVAAALLIPNTLRWRSDNPYLESVTRVADYQEGSGRGRLVQYERSLRLAVHHPLLGVGPGNWAVEYPAHAARRDPSMDQSEPGMTSNPWPSSDWMAWIAERGFPAAILIALAFVFIAMRGLRQLVTAGEVEESLIAVTLVATLVAATLAGLFDAVLLLAVPAYLIWATLGALWASWSPVPGPQSPVLRGVVVLAVIAIVAAGGVRSAMQLVAMDIYSTRADRISLARVAMIDPGSYRAHLRLARMGRSEQRCKHARKAHALYPRAEAAAEASRRCGE